MMYRGNICRIRNSVLKVKSTVNERSLRSIQGPQFSSWSNHNNSNKAVPFVEHFRPCWPERPMQTSQLNTKLIVPVRTVPDSVLTFKLKATFDQGTAIYYPHLQFNPADFKVKMMVIRHKTYSF